MSDEKPAIDGIYIAALELRAQEREIFLDQVCAGHPDIKERVQKLLKAHEQAGSFLEAPAPELLSPAIELNETAASDLKSPANDEKSASFAPTEPGRVAQDQGDHIGPYKLLEEIGEGGMGTVWVAQQSKPIKRRVAIKLIKAGMDSKSVLARFEAERQALAMMDHPNIARVLDGGMTDQGRPYFAMEYVKGVPLTEYCDHAKLSVKQRLELFLPICQAVQHAHQKGIIHRDLKPSNILICLYDGKPVPKVIDFGLAKAMHQSLTEQSLYTAHGVMVGTPLYMSPEQAEHNNLDVDTRTDIYSLGVILYELLTGGTPLEKGQMKQAAFNEILRLIKEVEPPKPSTRLSGSDSLASVAAQRSITPAHLSRSLSGDLDWVIMKALEKERGRRYETANCLAADIRRHLEDELVSAGPPSAKYRMQKFVKRNRAAVITASLVCIALVLGVIGTSWGMWSATVAVAEEAKQREIAQENEKKANVAKQEAMAATKLAESERDEKVKLAEERRRALYISDMKAIRGAWDESNVARVQKLLKGHIPSDDEDDLRGFEWFHYWNLCEPARRCVKIPISGGSYSPKSVSFGPKGRKIIVATKAGSALLFDWSKPTISPEKIPIRQSRSTFAIYAPDGSIVYAPNASNASANSSFEVQIRSHGDVLCLNGHESPADSAVYSKTGDLLATSSGEEIIVWKKKAQGYENLCTIAVEVFRSAYVFSPDSKFIYAANTNGLHVYDARTGEKKMPVGRLPEGSRFQINTLASSLDGAFVFAGSEDGSLIAWNTGDFSIAHVKLEHGDAIRWLAQSPTGNILASASRDCTIKLWDSTTLEVLDTLKGHSGIVNCVCFSPDGQSLVSASQDYTLRRWELSQLEKSSFLPTQKGVLDALTIKDRNIALVRSSSRIPGENRSADAALTFNFEAWDGRLGADDSVDGTQAMAASDEGDIAFVRDQTIDVERRGHLPLSLTFEGDISGNKPIQFSSGGKYLALALTEGVAIWEFSNDTDEPSRKDDLPIHSNSVSSLAFSFDEKMIAIGFNNGNVKLRNLPNGKLEWEETSGHHGEISCLQFDPNGEWLASGSYDNQIIIRHLHLGTSQSAKVLTGHTASVWDLLVSKDGKQLFSAGGDQTIRIWDTDDWQERGVLKGHKREVTCLDWLNDGSIVSGGTDGLRVWRRASSVEGLRQKQHHELPR